MGVDEFIGIGVMPIVTLAQMMTATCPTTDVLTPVLMSIPLVPLDLTPADASGSFSGILPFGAYP